MAVVAVATKLTQKVLPGSRLSQRSGFKFAFSSRDGGCTRGSWLQVTVVLPLKDRAG